MIKSSKTVLIALLTVHLFWGSASLPYAEAQQAEPRTRVDYDLVEYKTVLGRLDGSRAGSILTARDELFARFRNKSGESCDEAFRAFRTFYKQVLRETNEAFSRNDAYQSLLSEIAQATGLYFDPFPAFEHIDTPAARTIREKNAVAYGELMEYRNAGMNFDSSEGLWYLKSDLDFLVEVSSIASGEMKKFVKFYAEEWRKTIADDGGLLITWEDLRKRIVRQERFARRHAGLKETEEDIKPSLAWMVRVYLVGIDNSPAYELEETGRLYDELQKSYEAFLREDTGSGYYKRISDVYGLLQKNDFRVSRELVDYLERTGYADYTYMRSLERFLDRQQQREAVSTGAPAGTVEAVGTSLMVPLIIVGGVAALLGLFCVRRLRKRGGRE
jgi:hypothetical protein